MKRRMRTATKLLLSGLLVALLLSLAVAPVVHAQVRIAPEAQLSEAEIQEIFTAGEQLERDRRWGEALSHYQEAIRNYPGRTDLKQRESTTRIHFDLARRYADRSYTEGLTTLTERETIDLYAEVLLKIQSHYVTAPDWRGLLQRGVTQLDVALDDEHFVAQHLADVPAERIDTFRGQLHRGLTPEVAPTRQQAAETVAAIARNAARELGISPVPVILEFVCGAVGALDNYSAYLSAAQLDEVYSQIDGNFVGLGIELKADDGALLIVNVITGSPADRAGIRPGDHIVSVQGKSTRDASPNKAADLLKGKQGTTVEVTVVSPGQDPRRLTVRRERVEVPSVEDVKILDQNNGVAYLRLSSFQKTTSRDMDAALWRLHRMGMRSLIVDVRGNPGGLLTASVEVADKFVTEGTLVSTRGRSQYEDYDYRAHRVGTWGVPLVVLIDRDTASASEILAGAIRDHRRGQIVGQRSYGKGSVQGIFPLHRARAGVRLTTAKFYSPDGQPISKRGIGPDVIVRTAAKPADDSTAMLDQQSQDAALNAALQTARKVSKQ